MSAVYLSGPISGLTYEEARWGWREEFTSLLSLGAAAVLSPMRHEGHLAEVQGPLDVHYPQNLFSRPKMIVAKDFLDIDRSDIMVVCLLDARRVSIGTMVELGYARAKGKTVVTIMADGNLHDHPFVRENSDVVVDNVADAAKIVNSLLSVGL